MLISLDGEADFRHARDAVASEPHRTAVLVDVEHRYKGEDEYLIEVDGQERLLDFAHFLPDDSIGSRVSYVVDPDDKLHFIAVGEPEDWAANTGRDVLVSAVITVMTLIFVGVAVGRIIPEDAEAAAGRAFDFVEEKLPARAPKEKHRPRRRRRRGGGTGRHAW